MSLIYILAGALLFYAGYYTGKRDAHDPVPFFPPMVTQVVDKLTATKEPDEVPEAQRVNKFYS